MEEKLPEIEVDSGEKDEHEISKFRCALYRYAGNKNPPEWVTRGIGDVRFLKHNVTNEIRVLLREAKTSLVRMNHTVNPQSPLTPKTGMEDRAWSWFAVDYADEAPKQENFAIKFKTPDIAQEFKKVYDEARKNNSQGGTPSGETKSNESKGKTKGKSKDQQPAKPAEAKPEPKKESKKEAKENVVTDKTHVGSAASQPASTSSSTDLSPYEARAIEAERLLQALNLRLTSLEQVLQLSPAHERKVSKPIILGYWAIRGLAQPIRYVLKYLHVPFEEKRYTTEEQWTKDKWNLGITFPNLPYMFDGDKKLVQSNAILFYIARNYGPHLLGSISDQTDVDEILGVIFDFRESVAQLAYDENFAGKLNAYKTEYLPKTLKSFSDHLKTKGDKWIAGSKIMLPDFVFYEILDQNRLIAPGCLDAYPNLANYIQRFTQITEIAGYQKQKDFISRPIFGSSASFK